MGRGGARGTIDARLSMAGIGCRSPRHDVTGGLHAPGVAPAASKTNAFLQHQGVLNIEREGKGAFITAVAVTCKSFGAL